MELTTTSPEFIAWLAGAQKICDDYKDAHFPTLGRDTLTAEEGSKVIKIVRNGSQRMVHCFIAKVDNTTKELGTVKCGDVLMSASWKKPAKHARGNLWDNSKGLAQMGPYGPAYLK